MVDSINKALWVGWDWMGSVGWMVIIVHDGQSKSTYGANNIQLSVRKSHIITMLVHTRSCVVCVITCQYTI